MTPSGICPSRKGIAGKPISIGYLLPGLGKTPPAASPRMKPYSHPYKLLDHGPALACHQQDEYGNSSGVAPLAQRVNCIDPLSFLVGRSVFCSDALALGCAAVVAAMPEFAIDVARVGNECAAVALFTLLTWLIVESVRVETQYFRALSIGVVLGLGLLTKAYFLTALPPVALLLAHRFWRERGKPFRAFLGTLVVISSSLAIAAWWYVRNVLTTGTWSGLSEAAMLRGTISPASMLQRAIEIHWPVAIDAILLSHLWFGGWSSLTIRSWMYHLFYLLIVPAAIALVRLGRQPAIVALAVLYATFWIGQLYNVLLLFLAKGMATSMGWYMYTVVAAEVRMQTPDFIDRGFVVRPPRSLYNPCDRSPVLHGPDRPWK